MSGRKQTVKILHIGDLHLDSPFASLGSDGQAKANAELRRAFSRAIGYARENAVQIVLIAGDLFDREYYSRGTLDTVCKEMESVPDCVFVISPGNHDPITPHSPYKTERFPRNCHVFDSESLSCLQLPELNTDIYGYAFVSSELDRDPLCGFKVERPERLNLLCAHSEIGVSGSVYAPIDKNGLMASGINYAALGHIHTDERIYRARLRDGSECFYAYSGCIAGRDFGETGEKGGILITAELSEGKKRISPERVTFCPWVYRELTADVGGISDTDALAERISSLLPRERSEVRRYLRITLRGGREGDMLDAARLKQLLAPLGDVTLTDETVPAPNAEELERDSTLKGAAYRYLKERLSSESYAVRREAQLALTLAISALEGGNPAEIFENFGL